MNPLLQRDGKPLVLHLVPRQVFFLLAGVAVSAGGEPSLGSPRARAREDAVRRSDVRDAVLDAAPTRSGSFFVVQRILDPQGEEGSL